FRMSWTEQNIQGTFFKRKYGERLKRLNDKGIQEKKKKGEERKEGEGTHYNIYVRARKGEGTA
ncbi:hypothetical protein, partial [Bacteroides heparinolyticus]|uniref:hypothetical protein n=1 Tax=Prevotella heparinolytica TaxID=28113 RepID=UPI0035A04712